MKITVMQTADYSPPEREDALRFAVRSQIMSLELDHHVPALDISAEVTLSRGVRFAVCSAKSSGVTIRRTIKDAKAEDQPAIYLGLQISGTALIVQNDKEAFLRPGEFTVFDTSVPYKLIFKERLDHQFFRVPREALALPKKALGDVIATKFGADNPLAQLASSYFSRLGRSEKLQTAPFIDSVSQPSIELIRAVLATHLQDDNLEEQTLRNTLYLRIMEYLHSHLTDRNLSALQIAHHHNISVRSLYLILASSGISLGDWIRTNRLERCRHRLTQANALHLTIAAIAHQGGFADAAHFSRLFKQTYGTTPRDWRMMNASRRSSSASPHSDSQLTL